MGNNSNGLLQSFINRFNFAKNEEDLQALAKDIENFLKMNKNEENLKVLLADIYTLLDEKDKLNRLLNTINIYQLDEEFKIGYIVFLFDVGNFEKLLDIIQNIDKLEIKKVENLITVKLIYISIAIEYFKIPVVEEEIKEIYKLVLNDTYYLSKFITNFDKFLSAVVAVSKLENVEYLLYKVYLYLKAKLLLKENYKKGLKIVEDILANVSSKYLAYFSVSLDEENIVLVLVLDDLIFDSVEEFLDFRMNLEKEIREKFSLNFPSFPKFTVSIPNPIIEECEEC
ncbi:MAG: hypothetical protein DSY66_05395 [Persephonella sp.]|nr:MAG: hypothetical protein DSY53_04665 [Persephonella sp.]RUM59859.1 MAG: hypothetical protein DSY66_05395 [Persephonella sp.]